MPSTKEQVCDHLDFLFSEACDLDDPRFQNHPPTDEEFREIYEAYKREHPRQDDMIRLNKVVS